MSVLLSFRILSIRYLRPETAVPLNVALVEGNETLHTSHLQCHIFVPLPSLPPSLPQHTTIYNGKRLLTVLHPAVSCFVFLSLARPAVGPPLVILCLCSVPSLPPSPTPHPFRFCIPTHMVSSTNHVVPIPNAISLKKRQTTYSLHRIVGSAHLRSFLIDLKLTSPLCIFISFLGFCNLNIRCITGCTNLAFQHCFNNNTSGKT